MGQPDDRDKAAWILSMMEPGGVFHCKSCGDLYAFPGEATQREILFLRGLGRGLDSLAFCGPCANKRSAKVGFSQRIHFRGPNPLPPLRRYK